jgi:hypothetical protein
VLAQLKFGPQLLAGCERSRLDLLTQILSNLPVHGVRHRSAARLNRWFSVSIARIRAETRVPTGQDC